MTRRYRTIYFIPNPFLDWEMPWCFEIQIGDTVRRIRSGLSFTKETTGGERRAVLANYCWEDFGLSGNFLALGPHFRRREWHKIPSGLRDEDVDSWLLGMVILEKEGRG